MPSFQLSAVYLIANFFIYMIMLLAVQLNCESRFGRWKTVLINILSYPINMAISLVLPHLSFVRLLLGCVYVILLVQLLYKNKWLYKFLVAFAAVLSVLLSEALYGTIMPRDAFMSGELIVRYSIPSYTGLIFVNFIIQTINVLFVRLLQKRRTMFSGKLQNLLFMVFPISQFASVWLFFSSYKDLQTDYNPWYVLPVVLIYLIADVALFFSLRMSEKNAIIMAKTELLEEEIAFQKKYHSQLASSYEQIRKLRHDIDNHLYTVQTMLKAGQSKAAAQYAQEVFERESPVPLYASCRNTIVGSFLEKKKEDFEANRIILDCEIQLPVEAGISNPDLICVFGNILNNAQEACEGIENSRIVLRVNYQKPYLSIFCENPVRDTQNKKRNRIPGLERGIGLLILEDLAKQYDGELRTEFAEETFQTQLVLKGRQTEC